MARVNPPEHLRTPQIQDARLFRFLEDLKYIVFQLWKRTGGGNDNLEDDEISRLFSASSRQDPSELNESLLSLYSEPKEDSRSISFSFDASEEQKNLSINFPQKESEVLLVDSDFTCSGSATVVCENAAPATVTLTANPDDGELITVKRVGSGAVTVSAAVNIDGSLTQSLNVLYDTITVQYIGEINQWIII